MYHPLLADVRSLRDTDVQAKITDLSRKYNIAFRLGEMGVCEQISIIMESLQLELQDRARVRASTVVNKTSLDKLIKSD